MIKAAPKNAKVAGMLEDVMGTPSKIAYVASQKYPCYNDYNAVTDYRGWKQLSKILPGLGVVKATRETYQEILDFEHLENPGDCWGRYATYKNGKVEFWKKFVDIMVAYPHIKFYEVWVYTPSLIG